MSNDIRFQRYSLHAGENIDHCEFMRKIYTDNGIDSHTIHAFEFWATSRNLPQVNALIWFGGRVFIQTYKVEELNKG